jgi:hypothetical protein
MTDQPPAAPFRRSHAASTLLALAVLALAGTPAAGQEAGPISADTLDVWQGPAKSPRGAFLRSLVLPGWGQAWVGAPGRGAAYFALEAGSLWMVYRSRERLGHARAEQELLRQTGQLAADARTPLVRAREAQVEDWTALAVFVLFFSAADALVAAYLADFSEHVGVVREADGLRLEARVPVGRP